MTDSDHKIRQCRAKADSEQRPWAICTDPNDFEPKVLCDYPLDRMPAWMDIEIIIYPRIRK